MGLKFLKRRAARKESSAIKPTTADKALQTSVRTVNCDESTLSDSSRGNKVTALENLARNAKWDAAIQLVKESHADDWTTLSVESSYHALEQGSGGTTTPLHVALAHRAPVKVVDALIIIMRDCLSVPVPEEVQDEQGRTPLHIAVTAGCEEDIAVRLLTGCGLVMPAVLRDHQEQTPLHAACAAPIVKGKKKSVFGPNQMALQKWNKRRVMTILMQEYPEAAALVDKFGKTPLDYARAQGIKDSSILEIERLCCEHAPPALESCWEEEKDCAADYEMSQELKLVDVPLIVPSPPGSCRNFASVSTLKLDDINDDDIPEPSDVSTIGDEEAEMYSMDSFDY